MIRNLSKASTFGFRYLHKALLFLCLLGLNGVTNTTLAETVRMTFILSQPDQSLFWQEFAGFMRAVAEDLDIQLDFVATNNFSDNVVKRDGVKIINRADKPDFILSGYWSNIFHELFEAGQQQGIQFFIVNNTLSKEQKRIVMNPRTKYPNWIGSMHPDELGGGRELTRILVNKAQKLSQNSEQQFIGMSALTGHVDLSSGNTREAGFREYIADNPNLKLNSIISTTWMRGSGIKATHKIINDFPDTSIIWAISDELSLDVIDVLKARKVKPGVDIVTGGFDWSKDALNAIRKGEMTATVGGHFMEGGWAMILAYDYYHGHDFSQELGTTIVSPMKAITAENIDYYYEFLVNSDWNKIDFKQFSKTHNPNLKAYDFSLESLLAGISNK